MSRKSGLRRRYCVATRCVRRRNSRIMSVYSRTLAYEGSGPTFFGSNKRARRVPPAEAPRGARQRGAQTRFVCSSELCRGKERLTRALNACARKRDKTAADEVQAAGQNRTETHDKKRAAGRDAKTKTTAQHNYHHRCHRRCADQQHTAVHTTPHTTLSHVQHNTTSTHPQTYTQHTHRHHQQQRASLPICLYMECAASAAASPASSSALLGSVRCALGRSRHASIQLATRSAPTRRHSSMTAGDGERGRRGGVAVAGAAWGVCGV